jgi:hypothetical protein
MPRTVATSISARSSLPCRSASFRSSLGTARSSIRRSFALSPHHFLSRTSVTARSPRPVRWTRKGPADSGSDVRAARLKSAARVVTDFGYSGVKSDFQSA